MFESRQDIVLTLNNLVFISALLPMLTSRDVSPLTTSALNGAALTTISVAYHSLGLYFSAACVFLTGALWFVVLVWRLSW